MSTRAALAFIGAGLAIGLAAAGITWAADDGDEVTVSDVIFPPQEIPLRFSHAQHLADDVLGADDCVTCHEQAPTSRSSLDNLIPREEACAMCHPIQRSPRARTRQAAGATEVEGAPPGSCETCHPGWDPATGEVARIRIPLPNLKFDHQVHVSRGIDCRRCHGDLAAEGVGLATRAQLPRMELCLTCHDGEQAPDACTTCHLAEAGGFVRTTYAEGTLVPRSGVLRGAAHGPTFRTNHGRAAEADPEFCGSCHRKPFCTDCHDGALKPMDFHPGDYVTLHAIDARRNTPDCSTCHRRQTFCTGCHARAGVSSDPRGGSQFDSMVPGRRFHPEGWASFVGRGPNHHAWEAQRNIQTCASCHREQFCLRCHTAEMGSPRISPHPRGWIGSQRCESLLARNARMCTRCHIDPSEVRCSR